MAHSAPPLKWSPPSDLALETVHHAVDHLASTRRKKPAIDVINEDGNGLTPAQKGAISARIMALEAPPVSVRGKNQIENKLNGVFQPNTLELLETPDAILNMLASRLLSSSNIDPQVRLFTIQISAADIEKAQVRQLLRQKEELTTEEIASYVETLYGTPNNFEEGSEIHFMFMGLMLL